MKVSKRSHKYPTWYFQKKQLFAERIIQVESSQAGEIPQAELATGIPVHQFMTESRKTGR